MTNKELLVAIKKYLVTGNRYLIILAIIGLVVGGIATNKYVNQKIEDKVVAYFDEHRNELKGDKGDTGEEGEIGGQGPQGGVGLAGIPGKVGAAGKAGAAGKVGAAGKAGEAGSKGATGGQGRTGNNGCTWMPYSQYWYCP